VEGEEKPSPAVEESVAEQPKKPASPVTPSKISTLADDYETAFTDPLYLIDKLLPTAGLSLFAGDSGAGKSTEARRAIAVERIDGF